MEAVPRMPMIAFDLKNGSEVPQLVIGLKQCIATVYHERPSEYSNECSEFEQLRHSAVRVSRDFMGCSTLKKYYAQLQFLRSRFPVSEDGALGVPFTWDDVYTGRPVTSLDIQFEQGSILYNIGALHSILGAMDSRHNPEGMKVSCTHFQCAAWAFQQLRDCFEQDMSADMTHDLLTFMFHLMLAQAQECILEKSMMDNRKSSITAKVAAQIIEYYQLALKNLDACNAASITGGKRYKEWKKRIELKMNYHQCIVYYYQGCQAEDQEKWGERVAFFKAAVDKLNEATKLAKGEESDITEALKFTMDVVGGKYNSAKKDNDFIYYDKVPPLDSLPEVKGAQLVKGMAFNYNDPEISGPDIFKRLVPIEVHEASSLYSEEKAKLLRRISGLIEEKNEELQQFQSSLQIDPDRIEPAVEPLPQILLEKCAAISVKPDAIKDLTASMTALSGISIDVEGNISDIMELLQKAEAIQKELGDNRYQPVFEQRHKECLKYKEGLAKASESNRELHKAMSAHVDNLRLLSGPLDELKAALPSMDHNISPADQEVIDQMRKLMSKVDEMKNQRSMLMDQLRKQIQEDDITNALIIKEVSNFDEFFQEQLKKHDKEVKLIEQNIGAQVNILKALTETNAKYASLNKQMEECNQRRTAKIDALIQSCEVYEDLLAKCQKGVEFYNKLMKNVQSLAEETQNLYHELEEKRKMTEGHAEPKDVGSSIPGMPPVAVTDIASDNHAPRLTLKDYLPYMKPATFGKKSTAGELRPEQPAPCAASDALDPNAMMTMYSGMSGGISLVPQIPMHAGSLPGSHTASPVHIPKQPSSQPGSPGHGANRGTTPGLPDHTSYGVGVSGQASVPACSVAARGQQNVAVSSSGTGFMQHSVPSNLPTTSIGARSFSPEQVLSPTSAPGAPSTRRPAPYNLSCMASSMETPPGGPSSVADGSQGVRTDVSCQQSQHISPMSACSQPPTSFSSRNEASMMPASSATQVPSHFTAPHQGNYSQAPGQPQPYGSVQTLPNQYSLQFSQVNQPSVSQDPARYSKDYHHQAYSQKHSASVNQASELTSAALTSQHITYSSQPHQEAGSSMKPVLSTGYNMTAGGHWNESKATDQTYHGQMMQPTLSQHMNMPQQGQNMAGNFPSQSMPGQPSTGQPEQLSTGQPGQPLTGQRSQLSSGQPGQLSTGQPGQMFIGQPGQLSTAKPGQLSMAQPGQLSISQSGQLSTGQLGPMPVLQPGQLGTVQQGQMSSRQPSQLPAGQPNQLSTGQPNQMASGQLSAGQPSQLATGQQSQLYRGQQSQLSSGQLSTGQLSQLATGQPSQLSAGQQNQSATAQPAQISTGQPYQLPMAQQSNVSTGQPRQLATGQLGQLIRQQPNQPAMGQPRQLGQFTGGQTGQMSQFSTGQLSLGQQSQTPAGQSIHVGVGQIDQSGSRPQGQPNASQPGLLTGGQMTQFPGGHPSQQTQQIPNQLLPQHQRYVQSNTAAPGQSSWANTPSTNAQSYSSSAYYPQVQTMVPTVSSGMAGGQTAVCHYPGGTSNQRGSVSQYQVPSVSGVAMPYTFQPQYSGRLMDKQPTSQACQSDGNRVQPSEQQRITSMPGNLHDYGYQTQQGGQTAQYINQTGYTQPASQSTAYQQGYVTPKQGESQQIGPRTDQEAITPNLPSPLQPTEIPVDGVTVGQSMPTAVPQPNVQQQGSERASSLPPTNSDAAKPAGPHQTKLGQVSSSSLDDLLSSSPERTSDGGSLKSKDVLVPKVITEQDIREQREEQMKNSLKQSMTHDPYTDPEVLNRFVTEVEKYEKFVESMTKETLSGPTPLDKEWKELAENQEKEAKKHSMAIARCYPLKNRFPDIMPYDGTRVILKGGKDDYINANHLGELSPVCPKFIATQAPLPGTIADFWQMVYEQGTEVIVALCQEHEAGKKNHVYWPLEKGQTITHDAFTLYLQSSKDKDGWIERIITVTHKETRHSRSVVHLQFLNWPSGGIPSSPTVILQFICETHMFFIQQRNLVKPVIVHCSNGVDRTGAFCVIYAGIQEINQGRGLVNVTGLVKQLREKRKYMVGDKELLRFCHSAILYYAQDLLMKRGILTNCARFSDKLPEPGKKSHQRKPSEDFILGKNINLSTIQSSVAKMKIHSTPSSNEVSVDPITSSDPTDSGKDTNVSQPMTEHGSEENGTSQVHDKGQVTSDGQTEDKIPEQNAKGPTVNNAQQPLSNLPPSLADLQNPRTFNLEVTPPNKRKITKSSFLNARGQLADNPDDSNDPLNSLDPLWTIKQNKT